MNITLYIEQDVESAGCNWPEVASMVRDWAAAYVSPVPELCPAAAHQRGMELSMSLATDDFLSAISRLHRHLFELQVNFTLSVD